MHALPYQPPLAPRRLWVALLLTLAMPGLGHLYCGQARRGLGVWAVVFGVFVLSISLWTHFLFVPLGPSMVLLAGWAVLQLALGVALRRLTSSQAQYRLHPLNHPVSYVAVFLGLGVLPTLLTVQLVGAYFVGSVVIEADGNFPMLLVGDRLLYERRGFADRSPEPGELVVIAWPPQGTVVARVIAGAGHTVHLRDGRPVVDGRIFDRQRLELLRVQRFSPEQTRTLDRYAGYLEQNNGREYVVVYGKEGHRQPDPPPARVGPGEIYVLADNRTAALRDRRYGKVPLSAVRGRPRYIWASFDTGSPRVGRVGLSAR